MSAYQDAKRFLELHATGVVVGETVQEHLEKLVAHCDRYLVRDHLVTENQKLMVDLAVSESRVTQANSRAREIEHTNVKLEQTVKDLSAQLARCQTLVADPKSRVPSPEINTDRRLDDPSFTPCREERCSREDVHAQGTCGETTGRGPYNKRRKQPNE